MAKNNNLTDYLTDLANAIREKKGITDPINPQDFSAEIASIETGGGGGGGGAVAASAGAINFRDYDGTILHSFSKDEFLALTELPPLPTQPGLICQEWNYTIEDAKAYVEEYGMLEVGATYITDDGKTRLYISVPKGRQDVPLYFSQTIENGVTIDWGDGSATETYSGTGKLKIAHHYNNSGDYVISLDVTDGCALRLGEGTSTSCVLGLVDNNGKIYCNMLKKVEVGKNMTFLSPYSFQNCYSLASVVIPKGVTGIGNYIFSNCYSLASLVLPKGSTTIGYYAFQNCRSLASVVLPKGISDIDKNVFDRCSCLATIIIPQGTSKIGEYAFSYCYALESVIIPKEVITIAEWAFSYCYALQSVVIPEGVKNINNRVFYSCLRLASVVIPEGVIAIKDYLFEGCYALKSLVMPKSTLTIGYNICNNCYSLSHVEFPTQLSNIGTTAFKNCYSLASVVIPKGVTGIGASAFSNCYGLSLIDFTAADSIPNITSTSVFENIPSDCKIVVPDALYESWIAASNWSSFASKIVKASEFNG